MKPPDSFSSSLHTIYDGRFRCRWSDTNQRWQIEMKIDPSGEPPAPLSDMSDELRRAVDGYVLFLEVSPGTRTPCPRCGRTIRLVQGKVAQVTCGGCNAAFITANMELGTELLNYIGSTDWIRGHAPTPVEQIRRLHEKNQNMLKKFNEGVRDTRQQALDGYFNSIVGIEQTGYTGKEFTA